MKQVVITESQKQAMADSRDIFEVVDEQGVSVGHFRRWCPPPAEGVSEFPPSREEAERILREEPSYTSEQVTAMIKRYVP